MLTHALEMNAQVDVEQAPEELIDRIFTMNES